MKLYITTTSPFAWMVRIVLHAKNLADRLEIIPAQTRRANSPYYGINPSGRVPFLILDDGRCFEESQLIIRYLDHLDGAPMLDHPAGEAGWESRRLEALARSMLDGLSVWGRELNRAEDERSPTLIKHERARAGRMAELWEGEIGNPLMTGSLNMATITLTCALNYDRRIPGFNWRDDHPRLAAWAAKMDERPAIRETWID